VKNLLKKSAAVAGVGAAALGVAGAIGFKIAAVRKERTEKQWEELLDSEKWQDYAEDIRAEVRWFHSMKPEEVSIRSKDGLKLYGWYLEAENPRACVLMCHGYRSGAMFDFSLVLRTYYEHGCSLLVIDQRAHGRSEGGYIGYGLLERYDCQQWAWYLSAKTGGRLPVVMDGISMGASTVMMAADLELPRCVVGIIADSGYNSPWDELRHCMKNWYHLPAFPVLHMTNLFCKAVAGYDLKENSAANSLAASSLPILLIHGTGDDFVPAYMTEENYAAAAGEKRQILVEGADHGMSYLVERERCKKEVLAFIDLCAEGYHGA